jgi:glycosyltransferase involved in cell wall biosynthesis
MRIVLALLYYDETRAVGGPTRYLDEEPLDRELGAALARAGHDVEVVIHFPIDTTIEHERVRIHFVAPSGGARALGSVAKGLGRGRAYYEPALRAIDAIVRARADIVHFHGTAMNLNLALLRARLDPAGLVVQHHGGGPAKTRMGCRLQRWGLARADRLLFVSKTHARPFVAAGVIRDTSRIECAFEISTAFKPPPLEDARRRSGLVGDPIFVSAGRLHPDKDPLTMLKGFELIAQRWPEARLYVCYITDELLSEMVRYVARRPGLEKRVHFLGRIPHDEMAAILGSADFLLQASLREVQSYAVTEALAAGAMPVVTRIDAFEEITDRGRHGLLFNPGDPEALARAVLSLGQSDLRARRDSLRAYFEAHLSFASMARRLEEIYGRVLTERNNEHQAPVSG